MQIGDEDTGKNRRIDQRVLWTTEAQKKTQVLDILRRYGPEDRVSFLPRARTGCTVVIVPLGGGRCWFSVLSWRYCRNATVFSHSGVEYMDCVYGVVQ